MAAVRAARTEPDPTGTNSTQTRAMAVIKVAPRPLGIERMSALLVTLGRKDRYRISPYSGFIINIILARQPCAVAALSECTMDRVPPEAPIALERVASGDGSLTCQPILQGGRDIGNI